MKTIRFPNGSEKTIYSIDMIESLYQDGVISYGTFISAKEFDDDDVIGFVYNGSSFIQMYGFEGSLKHNT